MSAMSKEQHEGQWLLPLCIAMATEAVAGVTHIVLILHLCEVRSLWNVAIFEEGVGLCMQWKEEEGISFLLLRIFKCSTAIQRRMQLQFKGMRKMIS